MLQNVDEQALRIRRIFGRPITNTLHVVPSEDRVGVITKASFESIHFALVHVIQTQFVNVVWRALDPRSELKPSITAAPERKDKMASA